MQTTNSASTLDARVTASSLNSREEISSDICRQWVLEIKCPFKSCQRTVKEAMIKSFVGM